MRSARILLVGAGVLLAVLVAGIVVALATVDAAMLIGPVKDRFRALTGRELAVDGSVRLDLSLKPKLLLADVRVSNAPWGSTPQMLAVERLEVAVALLPLLSRRVELIEVALVAPVLTLETRGDGQRNWDWGRAAATERTPDPAAAAPAIGVGRVEISRGTVVWRGAGGTATRVAIDRLTLRADDAAAPVVAAFRGSVDDVAVDVSGTFGPLGDLVARRWPYPVALAGTIAGQRAAIRAGLRSDGTRHAVEDLALTYGATELGGRFAVDTGGARPKLLFDLDGAALAAGGGPARAPAAGPAGPRQSTRLFPDTAIDLAPLSAVDAEGKLALRRLLLADGPRIDDVRMSLTLVGGQLDVPSIAFATLGGAVTGSARVDARQPGSAVVAVHFGARGLDLAALLAALGKPREVRGGKTDVDVDLALRGASPRAWAGSASGQVRVVVGAATLASPAPDLDSALDKLALAIDPLREREPTTALVCAVARLPLANGVARIDRSIAMETQQVSVAASGTLDLRNETLDLRFQPKLRKGIPIEIPNLAELVHVRGPFAAPQVRVDAAGTAKAVASIGAAVGTAGLSAIGQSLLERSSGDVGGLCRSALGGGPPVARPAPPGPPAAKDSWVDRLDQALGKRRGR